MSDTGNQGADDHSGGMIQPAQASAEPVLPIEPDPSMDGHENLRISYSGAWKEVASLALANALLSLITLGIYSFWGRTRIRRYLWSNTHVNGSPLEYHGTGGQLFIGFIIISALFVAVNFGFTSLQEALVQQAIQAGSITSVLPIIIVSSLLIVVLYVAFFAYIIYSVRRYWLAMTSWRGIRLRQGGTRRGALKLVLPRALLTVATLGFAYPWLALRSERYAYGNSHVGNWQFSFDANVKPLLRGWIPFWLSYFVLFLGPIIGFSLYVGATMEASGDPGEQLRLLFESGGPAIGGIFVAAGLGSLLSTIAYAFFRARYFNVGVSGIALGDLQFKGSLRASAFLSCYVRYILLTFVMMIPIGIVVGLIGAAAANPLFPLLLFLLYFVANGFAWNVIVVHGLWKARVEATTTDGTVDVAAIEQAHVEKVKQGEGFGTAFDAGFGEA